MVEGLPADGLTFEDLLGRLLAQEHEMPRLRLRALVREEEKAGHVEEVAPGRWRATERFDAEYGWALRALALPAREPPPLAP